MYLTAACPYCQAAERLLARKGVSDIERVFNLAGGMKAWQDAGLPIEK